MQALADHLLLAWGWRRALAAALSGAIAAFAQAPYGAFPVLWLALPALVLLLDGAVDSRADGSLKHWRAAFGVGWAFGFGYFLSGLWWIAAAFLVDVEQFGWMIPFAIAGLAAGLGLFMGLGTLIARLLWSDGPSRILALAVGLTLSEWVRGHVLTGFPWNALGYGLAANLPLMQAASLVGLWGMTFLAVVVFAAPVLFLSHRRADRIAGAAGLVLFLAILSYGAARLALVETAMVPEVKLRIMQPAVDQWQKWRPEHRAEIMARYLQLSAGKDGKALAGVTHLVWPESAFPFLLAQDQAALKTLDEMLPAGTTLLTGAIRAEPPGAGETRPRYYNSIYVLGDDAGILAAFDKVHLVPFGEYLPFQDALEAIGLRQFTQVRGGFTAGPALATLDVPHAPPVGPLICYEAIFPDAVVAPGARPGWLLNVTNDAWFGRTPGPHQHLLQVRLRAVEEGLPIVRSANSGISAVIDPLGRITASLPLGEAGMIDAPLPAAIEPPFNSQQRGVWIWLCLGAATVAWFLRGSQSRR